MPCMGIIFPYTAFFFALRAGTKQGSSQKEKRASPLRFSSQYSQTCARPPTAEVLFPFPYGSRQIPKILLVRYGEVPKTAVFLPAGKTSPWLKFKPRGSFFHYTRYQCHAAPTGGSVTLSRQAGVPCGRTASRASALPPSRFVYTPPLASWLFREISEALPPN